MNRSYQNEEKEMNRGKLHCRKVKFGMFLCKRQIYGKVSEILKKLLYILFGYGIFHVLETNVFVLETRRSFDEGR